MPAEPHDVTTFADLARRWRPGDFVAEEMDRVQTPALVINREAVDANIAAMCGLLGERWRPHVKTSKLEWTMRRLVAAGVTRCKCATPLELEVALRAGFEDVLVAFSLRGPGARRVAELAADSGRDVSVLVEDRSDLDQWRDSRVAVFIDIDPGTGRSGVPCDDVDAVVALARDVASTGLRLRGLHHYDGAAAGDTLDDRRAWCTHGLDALLAASQSLLAEGHEIAELVTSGSRTWPIAVEHAGLAGLPSAHTVSPGTVVYADARTFQKDPVRDALRPAAAIIARVTSVGPGCLTLDAGHKAVALSPHGPSGVVLGHAGLELQKPSEEHGPVKVVGASGVDYGDLLAVLPSHVGPTVNLHDHAVIVSHGQVVGLERVSARGHHAPLS